MNGARLPDGTAPKRAGDYAYMSYANWEHVPSFFLGVGEWHVIDPTGGCGAIGRHWIETLKNGAKVERLPAHTWEIHADGTVSFSPSLVMPGPNGWHGFLVRGVFS